MTDDEESLSDFCVKRRHGCVGVWAQSPFLGDVQALLKEWDYKKYRIQSAALARLWGCLVVACPDYQTEQEALEAGWDSDHVPEDEEVV